MRKGWIIGLGIALGALSAGGAAELKTAKASEEPFVQERSLAVTGDRSSVRYSPFPSVNVWRNQKSAEVDWGYFDVKIKTTQHDLSGATSLFVRVSDTRTSGGLDVAVIAVDGKDVACGWRYDPSAGSGYTVPRYTASATGDPADALADGEVPLNYWYTKLEPAAENWYEYTLSDARTYTSASAFGTDPEGEVDLSDVRTILFRVAMGYDDCHLNIGKICMKRADGSFVTLFDPAVANAEAGDVTAEVKDGAVKTGGKTIGDLVEDYSVDLFRAGEMRVGENVAQEWYGFTMPTGITDVSKYNGIAVTFDLTGCGPIFLNRFLADTTNPTSDPNTFVHENWYSTHGYAKFIEEDGSAYLAPNTIPAGFKGTVVTPFASLIPNGGTETKDGVFDTAHVRDYVGFTLRTTVGRGNFVIKDIRFVDDATLYYDAHAYYEDIDGNFVEQQYNNGTRLRVEVVAGSDDVIPESVGKYVLDKENPNNDLNALKSGGKKNAVKQGLPFDGAGVWDLSPTLYYKLAEPYSIERVFGLEKAAALPSGAAAKDILARLPQNGINVGLNDGTIYRLAGKWTIGENTEAGQTFRFVPAHMPKNLTDPNGLLTFTKESVREVTMIYIEEPPAKTSYRVGESLDLTGLQVGIWYQDGVREILPETAYTVSGFDGSTAGEQTVTVTVAAGGKTFTATFQVKVTGKADAEPEKKGCGSVLGAASAGMLCFGVAAACTAKPRKKREDEEEQK